jgi:hypothetical protein
VVFALYLGGSRNLCLIRPYLTSGRILCRAYRFVWAWTVSTLLRHPVALLGKESSNPSIARGLSFGNVTFLDCDKNFHVRPMPEE